MKELPKRSARSRDGGPDGEPAAPAPPPLRDRNVLSEWASNPTASSPQTSNSALSAYPPAASSRPPHVSHGLQTRPDETIQAPLLKQRLAPKSRGVLPAHSIPYFFHISIFKETGLNHHARVASKVSSPTQSSEFAPRSRPARVGSGLGRKPVARRERLGEEARCAAGSEPAPIGEAEPRASTDAGRPLGERRAGVEEAATGQRIP